MVTFNKIKLNGEEYIAIGENSIKSCNTCSICSGILSEMYDCKKIGINVLSRLVLDNINKKYYIYDRIRKLLAVHVSQLDRIKELIKVDISIAAVESNEDIFYKKHINNQLTTCSKCGGYIYMVYGYVHEEDTLCCNGLTVDDIYASIEIYPKYFKYDKDKFIEVNKDEYKGFKKYMLSNDLKIYKEAYDQLGYVIFSVSDMAYKAERFEYINELLNRKKKSIYIQPDIKDNKIIDLINEFVIESPIEQILFNKLYSMGTFEILPQYEIKPYRVDFLVKYKHIEFVIECDGNEYHTIQEDIPRQRYLQIKGYDIIRFTGKEILDDLNGCIRDIVSYINTLHAKSLKHHIS